MQVFKKFVCVSRRGLFFADFDTEDAALAYARQKAEANYTTMAVARVTRTIEPGGQETERDIEPAAAPVAPAAVEEMPAVPLTIPEGADTLVEVANG